MRLFDRAVAAMDMEAIFLAGAATSCLPKPTTLTLPAVTTTYGTGTYPAVAILTDGDGLPIAGKAVLLDQIAALPYGLIYAQTMAVTDPPAWPDGTPRTTSRPEPTSTASGATSPATTYTPTRPTWRAVSSSTPAARR